MVEFTYADIAGIAVFGAGRTVDVAGGAVTIADRSSYDYGDGWLFGIVCGGRLRW